MSISRLQWFTGFLSLLFLPLSAGALWSVLALRYQAELPAMAILCALALLPAREYLASHQRWSAAFYATFCCACGIFYAQWLKAAMVVTQSLAIGFIDAVFSIGPDWVFAIFQTRATFWSVSLMVFALLISGWIGYRASALEQSKYK